MAQRDAHDLLDALDLRCALPRERRRRPVGQARDDELDILRAGLDEGREGRDDGADEVRSRRGEEGRDALAEELVGLVFEGADLEEGVVGAHERQVGLRVAGELCVREEVSVSVGAWPVRDCREWKGRRTRGSAVPAVLWVWMMRCRTLTAATFAPALPARQCWSTAVLRLTTRLHHAWSPDWELREREVSARMWEGGRESRRRGDGRVSEEERVGCRESGEGDLCLCEVGSR